MYSILDSVSSDDAIYIIYYVIKLLNKGKNGPTTIIDIENIDTDLTSEQEVIANQLLKDIDFNNLEDDILIDSRISDLYQILRSKRNNEREIDITRGKELLKKMKEN
jgi:hypothetical protein